MAPPTTSISDPTATSERTKSLNLQGLRGALSLTRSHATTTARRTKSMARMNSSYTALGIFAAAVDTTDEAADNTTTDGSVTTPTLTSDSTSDSNTSKPTSPKALEVPQLIFRPATPLGYEPFRDPLKATPPKTGQSPFAGDTGLEWKQRKDGSWLIYDLTDRKKFVRKMKNFSKEVKDLTVWIGKAPFKL